MQKIIATVVAVAAGLLLTGCSAISAGTVIGKEHEPERDYTVTQCIPAGKAMICTPQAHHDDEDWRLDLREGDDTGFVYVTKQQYQDTQIGDYWGTRSK